MASAVKEMSVHAERLESPARHDASHSSAPSPAPRRAAQHMGDVGVGEGRAEARHRLDVAQRPDHRRPVEAEQADRVVGVGRQPRALGDHVEDAELAASPRGP